METEEVSTLRVSTRAIPYGHQSPAGLRNGLWPVLYYSFKRFFQNLLRFAPSFYHSFCSWLPLRYYGEGVLVAAVATALPMPIEGIVQDKETSCCLLNRSPLFLN